MLKPWHDLAFVVDIETTGLDSFRNEILTLSISALKLDDMTELDCELFRFKPVYKKYFGEEAEKVHGISWDESQKFNDSRGEYLKLIKFLSSYASTPQPLICHAKWFGKYFDSSFIDAQLDMKNLLFQKRLYVDRPISTLTMASTYGKNNGNVLDSYSLDNLCRHYGIKLKHHDAVSDREACQKLFEIFYTKGIIDAYTYPTEFERFEDDEKSSDLFQVKKTKKRNRKSGY